MSTLSAHTPASAPTLSLGALVARISTVIHALGEGLAAYHRYERLRARGVPHAEAAARSFPA